MKLESTTLAGWKGDGIYLTNPLLQGWLLASWCPMPEFNLRSVHNSKYLDPYHGNHISFSHMFMRQ